MQEEISSFICPGCGGEVPSADQEGEVSCPHCGELLESFDDDLWEGEDGESLEAGETAGENDGILPVGGQSFRSTADVASSDAEDVEEFVSERGHKVRRRRVRKKKFASEELKFVRKEKRKGKPGSRSKPILIGGGIVLLVAVSLGSILLYETFREKGEIVEQVKSDPILVIPDRKGDDPEVDYDVPVEKIEEVVRQFLQADSIGEMAPLVRHRERVEPLMNEFYARPNQAFRPTPVKAIGEDSSVSIKQTMRAVLVTLEDYSQRQIGVEDTGRGFLVDWESWVGYSGMSWSEFMRTKPTRPIVFRVRMKKESYYNYDFSDDSQWLCFRVGSPEEDTLWAYAPADTAPMDLQTWRVGQAEKLVILTLRYPEKATRSDQVVIDSFEADGWVQHGGTSP